MLTLVVMAAACLIALARTKAAAAHPQLLAAGWPFSWWLIVALLGAVFLLFAVVVYLRRVALGGAGPAAEGLTMEQAQQLHSEGLLSDQEFNRLRRALVRQFSESRDGSPPTEASPDPKANENSAE